LTFVENKKKIKICLKNVFEICGLELIKKVLMIKINYVEKKIIFCEEFKL